jgi:hypothetical protein
VVRDVNRRRAVDGGGVALVGWVMIKGDQGTHFIKYKTTTTTIIVVVVVPRLRRLCPFMSFVVVMYEWS